MIFVLNDPKVLKVVKVFKVFKVPKDLKDFFHVFKVLKVFLENNFCPKSFLLLSGIVNFACFKRRIPVP